MNCQPLVGIELHAQLLTKSKLFCGCPTTFGAEPNTHGCPICLGMPGVLPVMNRRAVEMALKLALAVGAEVQDACTFARKNYFYPDLPKGYQISQYAHPLALGGGLEVEVDGQAKHIRIRRVHLEEDAGKSVHAQDSGLKGESLVDVNRCGVPLLEIVSEPDLSSLEEVQAYLTKLRQVLVYLGVCDGNMEQGSIRMDVNVNMCYETDGVEARTPIFEIKNLNSFKFALRAIEGALRLQGQMLKEGKPLAKETLLFDPETGSVSPMRTKEEAHDYRYFPEPDLVPLVPDRALIEFIRGQLPELPDRRRDRFREQYGLSAYDAEVLTATRELADYYEACVALGADPKAASNWVMGDVLRALKDHDADLAAFAVTPQHLAELVKLIDEKTISRAIAKTVFEEIVRTGDPPRRIVERGGLVQIADPEALGRVIDSVLGDHPDEVEKYRQGKRQLLGFFMGKVMRATEGKANPQLVSETLKKRLKS